MTDTATADAPADDISKPSLTVLILAFNEERHIARALATVRGITRDMVVIDSFSTDRTAELATAAGARVLQHKFVNYAKQFQWGLDNGGITTDWVLRLDADEVIEPDLAAEIRTRLPALPASVAGVNLSRKHIFMGRWVRHGGRFPLVLLRIWRTGHGRIEERWMDEHMVVWGGGTVGFGGGFADVNLNDLTFFTTKHNSYATREALDVLIGRYGLERDDRALNARSASRQASLKRWLKERVYNRLPLGVGPLAFFLYRYFLQLGFLDGRTGLIYHFLQGFWYRFLVDAKLAEYEMAMAGCADNDARRATLTRLTGYVLAAPEPAGERNARGPSGTAGLPE